MDLDYSSKPEKEEHNCKIYIVWFQMLLQMCSKKKKKEQDLDGRGVRCGAYLLPQTHQKNKTEYICI